VESLFANEQLSQLLERGKRLMAAMPLTQLRIVFYLLIALWLMQSLVRAVWIAIPVPAVAPKPVSVAAVAGAADDFHVDAAKIQSWHLFGNASQSAQPQESVKPAANAVDESAEQTRLQLVLLGVIEVDVQEKAAAIIQAQGKEDLYTVGDKLPVPGNVTLAKVLSDRAIIKNNGRFESLLLYDESMQRPRAIPAPMAANEGVIDQRSDQAITKMAANYREQLLVNPVSLADVIRVSVAKGDDGSVIGYRIRPGRHQQQFTDFGFQPEDVVTAINGIELNNPTKALEVYRLLREAKDATFSVKRGDEDLTLIVGLDSQQ
jgi:general secretion pathway protein C